jgi:hypothetical protein
VRAPLRAALLLAAVSACGSPPRTASTSAGEPSQLEWTLARTRLAALRAALPARPHVEIVRLTIHEPRTGKALSARGAIAVDPHHAMRMILVGPGGATALDVWATPDCWRVAVPALEILRRGDAEEASGFPVGFFRWWFLDPLAGRLLDARAEADGSLFVLRADGATVMLRHEDDVQAFEAERRRGEVVDRVAWFGRSLAAEPGDRALYVQERTGVRVEVAVESLSPDPPDPAAFVDPDARGAP